MFLLFLLWCLILRDLLYTPFVMLHGGTHYQIFITCAICDAVSLTGLQFIFSVQDWLNVIYGVFGLHHQILCDCCTCTATCNALRPLWGIRHQSWSSTHHGLWQQFGPHPRRDPSPATQSLLFFTKLAHV